MKPQMKDQHKIKGSEWHRIDAGHYARRLPDGRNLVVRRLTPKKWADTNGGEHRTMTAAINESERIGRENA